MMHSNIDPRSEAKQAFVDAVNQHNGSPAQQHNPRLLNENNPIRIDSLSPLINAIDPEIGYDDWTKIGMALHHESNGCESGLNLFDSWSANGATYPGTKVVQSKWRSFSNHSASHITVGTIVYIAQKQGVDVTHLLSESTEPFKVIDNTVVVYPEKECSND